MVDALALRADERRDKLRNILFHSVPARDRKNEVLEVQCKHLTVLSAIRKLNLFSSLITGKDQFFFFIIWQPPTLPYRLQ